MTKRDFDRCRLLAKQAGDDPRVIAFRREVLNEKFLSMDDVGGWIEARCAEAREAKRGLLRDVTGKTVLLSYRKQDILYKVPVHQGGILHRLHELADDLAHRYGWQTAQAVYFLLAGARPSVPTISYDVSPHGFTLHVHHSVSARQLADYYRQVRKEYGFKNKRPGRKPVADVNRKSAGQQTRRKKKNALAPGVDPLGLFHRLFSAQHGRETRRVTMSTRMACKKLSEKFSRKITRAELYRMFERGEIIMKKRGRLSRWQLPSAREADSFE